MTRPDRTTWVIIALVGAVVVALGGYGLYAARTEETADELAQTEREASESAMTIQSLCRGKDRVADVLRQSGACRESQQVLREVDDPDPDDPEPQDAEMQNPEVQDREIQQPEKQQPEQNDPEQQDPEKQQPEAGDDEVQEPEQQEPEVQEPEEQDAEQQEPERQDPEMQNDRCGEGYHPETRQVDADNDPATPPETWQVCVADEGGNG